MKRINNKRIGLLLVVVITMLMSCAPQLDDTPPPVDPYDVHYGARMMYVTSSFRVYAPMIDRMHVERIAMNVYGVRDVSWSPGSYIMTVQYYPGRTNTYLIQQAIARAGYDTSDYRAVNMRPVVIPPRRTPPPTRQVITVPRNQQPPRTSQPQHGQGVGVNNPNTHSGTATQPRTQGGNAQPQGNQKTQSQSQSQTTPQQNQQSQPATNTSSGGHFGGKRN